MALVMCEVLEGARPSEATAVVRDYQGRREFLPVDRGLLHQEQDKTYLPVGVVHVDPARKLALIALPVEADSGANRIWVKASSLHQPSEVAP
jgi:hypothetical protein